MCSEAETKYKSINKNHKGNNAMSMVEISPNKTEMDCKRKINRTCLVYSFP